MTTLELGWLVGILEGEGCFFYERSQAIAMMSTDIDVMETYIGIVTKIIGVEPSMQCQQMPDNKKDRFYSKIHGENARKILHVIVPHMHFRRRARIWQLLNGHKENKKQHLSDVGLSITSILSSIKTKELAK